VIYCVVPEALAPELYEKLVDYYADDSNVTVIIDRRTSERRNKGGDDASGQREIRDRRRRGIAGDFPPLAEGE